MLSLIRPKLEDQIVEDTSQASVKASSVAGGLLSGPFPLASKRPWYDLPAEVSSSKPSSQGKTH